MKKIPEIKEENKKEDDNSILSEKEIKQRSEIIRITTDIEAMMKDIKRTLEHGRSTNIKLSFSKSDDSSQKPEECCIALTKRYDNCFDSLLPIEEEYVLKEVYNALFSARINLYRSAKIVPSIEDTNLFSDLENTWYTEKKDEQK